MKHKSIEDVIREQMQIGPGATYPDRLLEALREHVADRFNAVMYSDGISKVEVERLTALFDSLFPDHTPRPIQTKTLKD